MNKQPVSYFQTDNRWKNNPYRVNGEKSTIGGSGCGPTCAAMLIETLTGNTYTPEDACAWSVAHGYKALNQGTYYSYFVPQFAAHNIECKRLNSANLYGKPDDPIHNKALDLLRAGYYLIACMGKGLWTSSGHFVVVWWEDGMIRINDPASTKNDRTNGDLQTFRSQVKYYWAIDARSYNTEDTPMDMSKVRSELTSCADTGDTPSEWAEEATDYCKRKGIFAGDGKGNFGWQQPITREAVAQIIYNTLEAAGALNRLADVKD